MKAAHREHVILAVMRKAKPNLILVYETEAACLARLRADGFAEKHACEISSYLAQSTDLAPEFGLLEAACRDRGMSFSPVELDDASQVLKASDPESSLVWTLTDGIAYFRGSLVPALARLNGLKTIGSDDSLFAICQDKFRSGAVLAALGLPVPAAGLARDGQWLVAPPPSASGFFVKPNRLGAKIGIWPDSRCHDTAQALDLSRRVFAAYRDDVVVQPYVAGRNVRASFLAVEPAAPIDALGIFFVESGGDFQTMADSMALYGETGAQAMIEARYSEPELLAVDDIQPKAAAAIRANAERLMRVLNLRDVFSMDFRVEVDDTVHLIEFEVCPGLPCFDFRAYCGAQWKMSLAEAMAATAANRFEKP